MDIAEGHGRRLGLGTLYAALTRLQARALVRARDTEVWRRPQASQDEQLLNERETDIRSGIDVVRGEMVPRPASRP